MNNDLTNKEQEIKDAVEGLSFDLNIDEIWSQVEPQLPPYEGRRRPVLWWITGAAGVLLLFVGMYYITLQDTNVPVLPSIITESQEVIVPSLITDADESSDVNDYTSTDLSSNNEDNLNEIVNTPTEIEEINTQLNIPIKSNTSYSTFAINNNGSLRTNENLFVSNSQNINSSTNSITPIEEKATIPNIIRERLSMSAIHRLEAGLIDAPQDIDIDIAVPFIEPLSITKWTPQIGIFSGGVIGSQKITFNSSEALDMTQFERESFLPSVHTSVMYGMQNNKGWFWNLGLSHSRIVGRYSNFDTVKNTSTSSGNTSYRIDSDGNVTGTQGDVNVTTITQNNVQWHRNHDYVNLRGELGRTILSIGRFSTQAFVSAGYNIWSRHEGYYFEEGKDIITTFENGEENPYQNQGFNLGGGLSLTYDLGNVSVGLSGNLSQAIQNSTNSTNYYQLKNSQYGIQLGVVYTP